MPSFDRALNLDILDAALAAAILRSCLDRLDGVDRDRIMAAFGVDDPQVMGD